jgi:release factor glutamine methyltransferase
VPTLGPTLREATRVIANSRNVALWNRSEAKDDVEQILKIVLGERARLNPKKELTPAQNQRIQRLVARRVSGEPVALIRGWIDFRKIRIALKPGVFTPRYSTEYLAGQAIRRLKRKRKPVSVDVACGAAPVALSIAFEIPTAQAWGIDISKDAVALSRSNARHLRLGNAKFKVSNLLGSLPKTLQGKVDLFSIHPPYVPKRDVKSLPKEIREFEPRRSLTDRSDDGLGLVRKLAKEAPKWLNDDGWLLVEVAPDLVVGTKQAMRAGGFSDITVLRERPVITCIVAGRL